MKSKSKPTSLVGGGIVGSVRTLPLNRVDYNPWNPNKMTREQYASLKHGLETDGWLASQALLVWESDEADVRKMLIIDGEHRWRVAKELGFDTGPMVLLARITEAKAKSLTVAMNARRGSSDEDRLGALLRSIQADMPDLALNVGISGDALAKLLTVPVVAPPVYSPSLGSEGGGDGAPDTNAAAAPPPNAGATPPNAGATPSNAPPDARMVQLFFDLDTHEEFQDLVHELAPVLDTKSVADTVIVALRQIADAVLPEVGIPDTEDEDGAEVGA